MFGEGSKLGVGGYTNSDFISDVDGRISTSWMYSYVDILEGFQIIDQWKLSTL